MITPQGDALPRIGAASAGPLHSRFEVNKLFSAVDNDIVTSKNMAFFERRKDPMPELSRFGGICYVYS